MASKTLTPALFMDGGSARVLIRYRIVENTLRLMGEIGADNVNVSYVGSPKDEVFDFRLQPSIYDQVFVRSAFDLAERGAEVQLEVLVMQSISKSKTLITRLSGRCSQGIPSGRSAMGTPQVEVCARLKKIHEEESSQSMTEAFKRQKMFSGRE